MLKKSENLLPLLIQNEKNDTEDDENILKEFILCNLFDQTFPNFVEKIEKILNDVIFNEINSE